MEIITSGEKAVWARLPGNIESPSRSISRNAVPIYNPSTMSLSVMFSPSEEKCKVHQQSVDYNQVYVSEIFFERRDSVHENVEERKHHKEHNRRICKPP